MKPQPTWSDRGGVVWKGGAYGLDLYGTREGAYANFIDGIKYRKDKDIRYHVGDVVAIAQSYRDLEMGSEYYTQSGWNNKMFVKAELMPHQIEITRMRIQRLQDISDEDCMEEGIVKGKCGSIDTHYMDAYYIPSDTQPYCTPRDAYEILIDSICGEGTWNANPFVWVYEFKKIS